MSDETDRELMARLRQGDQTAFTLLYMRYREPAYGFILRMLASSRSDADDLFQEVFVKLMRAAEFYDPSRDFRPWFFAIIRNHCINWLKSRHYRERGQTLSLDQELEGIGAWVERMADGADESVRIGDRDLLGQVQWAIGTLPPAYREIILLHAIEGFRLQEVATVLDVPAATVRTRLHRARRMLADRIGPVLDEADWPGGGRQQ